MRPGHRSSNDRYSFVKYLCYYTSHSSINPFAKKPTTFCIQSRKITGRESVQCRIPSFSRSVPLFLDRDPPVSLLPSLIFPTLGSPPPPPPPFGQRAVASPSLAPLPLVLAMPYNPRSMCVWMNERRDAGTRAYVCARTPRPDAVVRTYAPYISGDAKTPSVLFLSLHVFGANYSYENS